MDKDSKHVNLIKEIQAMLLASIGRMPGFLVILIVLSLTLSVLAGLALKIVEDQKTAAKEFMPLRIEATENAPQIDPKKIQGQWIVQTPDYAMSFSFIGDRFEWMVRFARIQEAQFYARGNFRIEGDVVVLAQRPDLGLPYDSTQPWLKFLPMAIKNINIRIALENGRLLWDVPASEQTKIKSHVAMIFDGNKAGHFVWGRP